MRSKGIIQEGQSVTVDNADESTNIGYLMALRQVDFRAYCDMAGEFDRLKRMIPKDIITKTQKVPKTNWYLIEQ
jgi:hypothetical protein